MADPRIGVFNPVLPLDVLIIKTLPKEGSMFMGVYPEGASVADIRKAVANGQLPVSLLNTRLRVLHRFELVEAVKIPRSPTMGWQVTAKGEQFAAENPAPEAEVSSERGA